MITDAQILDKIEAANQFIDKSYLQSLPEYLAVPLDDHLKKHNLTRLFHVQKIIYDRDEDVHEKMVNIFQSIMPFCKNLVFILKGCEDYVDLYIGVRGSHISDTAAAGDILKDSFLGNFPGSDLKSVKTGDISSIFAHTRGPNVYENSAAPNIAYVNITPSRRADGQGKYVQGLEKYIDTMRGSRYICEILASPIQDSEIEARISGFEELYSALYPFSKKTSSHGHNEGVTLTEGINESISHSISDGISKATGRSDSYNHGKNSGVNMGLHMLLNFGVSSGTHEGWTAGSNESNTNTHNQTDTETTGRQKSTSQTTGTTDNLTIEFRDKNIEELLKKIDRHIERMKMGISCGVWEVSSYFISEKRNTAAIAANTFRSLMLGDEFGVEKSNFTLFESADKKTAQIEEALSYCEQPRFLVPAFRAENTINDVLKVSPTGYINGKELALLFNLPRKSVNGIMVTEMAEFGRNVYFAKDKTSRFIDIGKIFHMGQVENMPVELDLDTLTSHCFITGSTGSGKSNTVYKLIEEVIKEPYQIPFLVIEPAKGEYRNEFRTVPGINLFSTNPLIDQMLKLNPFAFEQEIHILEHIDRLVEIFNGCWEMYAAMPAILKEAIEAAYVSKGWDLLNSVFTTNGEPVYPTFLDVLQELPKIINSSQYSADTKGDYIGALVTRVNSMTNGIYGQIFCDDFEVDAETLFDENTIVDLSRVGSSETKSLIMGILILKLTEHRMAKATGNNLCLRHLTVLEEAHNILKNTKNIQQTAGNSIVSKSVEMIVNSIAEMRTYGEGFIIVDQSPTSVDVGAIKNTNTKIIMRLPDDADCKIVGHSVSLSPSQVSELAKLGTGTAVVMQSNWLEPVLARITKACSCYKEAGTYVPFEKLKELRSVVLLELIDEYEVSDNRNVSKIIRKIESIDICPAKKTEMIRMVNRFHNTMEAGYDSILFGRTMLHLIGCNDVYRKAEQYLQYKTDSNGSLMDSYTDESLATWHRYIESVLPQYVFLDQAHREIVQQYILHAKKFENHSVSYSVLYRQLYSDIK